MDHNPTPAEAARLRQAQARFTQKTTGLSPEVLRLRLVRMANAEVGTGGGRIDPLERSLAQQTLDAMDVRSRIDSAQEELKSIDRMDLTGHRPSDPNWRGRVLAQREDLEKGIEADMGRALSLSQQTHYRAQEEAVAAYRKEAAQAQKLDGLRAAAEAKIAAQTVDNPTVDAVAAGMAARR